METICEHPLIEKNNLNTRIMNILARRQFATRIEDNLFEVNWESIRRYRGHISLIGVASKKKIDQWLEEVDTIYRLPDCPICKKFHEHNHGGLA